MISKRKATSLPRVSKPDRFQKPRSLSPNGRIKLTGDKYPVLPDLKKPTIVTEPNKEKDLRKGLLERILLYPRLDEPHPYPYIISPDVVLLDIFDDEKPPEKVQEDIVEKFILDTPFAKGFVDEIVIHLLEDEIRGVVLNFTNRQGPANKPSGVPLTSQIPVTSNSSPNRSKTNLREKEAERKASLAEDIILTEVIQTDLLTLIGNATDNRAIFLEDHIYKDILSNDRGYTVSEKDKENIQDHVFKVGKAIRVNKNVTDYSKFKDMPTRNFIYHFHTMWQHAMSEENYALRQLQLKFINEAGWNYFSKEIWKSVEISSKQLDEEEGRIRNLQARALSQLSDSQS